VPKYIRSDSLKEVLFRADYNHVRSSAICDIGTSGNRAKEGEEEEDEEEEEGGCIHRDQSKSSAQDPGICAFITA
jgi:hypothetical protein